MEREKFTQLVLQVTDLRNSKKVSYWDILSALRSAYPDEASNIIIASNKLINIVRKEGEVDE